MAAPVSTEVQLERCAMIANLFTSNGICFIDVESEFLNLLLPQQLNRMQETNRAFWKYIQTNQKTVSSVTISLLEFFLSKILEK